MGSRRDPGARGVGGGGALLRHRLTSVLRPALHDARRGVMAQTVPRHRGRSSCSRSSHAGRGRGEPPRSPRPTRSSGRSAALRHGRPSRFASWSVRTTGSSRRVSTDPGPGSARCRGGRVARRPPDRVGATAWARGVSAERLIQPRCLARPARWVTPLNRWCRPITHPLAAQRGTDVRRQGRGANASVSVRLAGHVVSPRS